MKSSELDLNLLKNASCEGSLVMLCDEVGNGKNDKDEYESWYGAEVW
jgi:hypothetical protein